MAAFKEFKRALIAELGAENVSAIPVIMELQSVEIFKDALCFMNNSEA